MTTFQDCKFKNLYYSEYMKEVFELKLYTQKNGSCTACTEPQFFQQINCNTCAPTLQVHVLEVFRKCLKTSSISTAKVMEINGAIG